MDEIKLKPCPFCGEKAQMLDTGNYWPKTYYRVISLCFCCMQGKLYDTPDDAAQDWNKRL